MCCLFYLGARMKTAAYWHSEENGLRCDLCPHFCLIREGGNGFCGVRGNRDGRLYALTWGQIVASAIDPIEKKPLYHFYPGHRTFSIGGIGCNLRCRHCQNWQISCTDIDEHGDNLQPLAPQDAVDAALRQGCRSLVWTYNEPSIWFEYIRDTAPLARRAGLKTVMVTAGMINAAPLAELLPHIDAYRLDIKGFSGKFYRWLTGIDCFEQVLENGRAAADAGCHVEIVTNLIPGHNDDEQQLRELARWIVQNLSPATPWHLTAYYPSHRLDVAATGVAALDRGVEIAHEEGLQFVYVGNVAGHPAQQSVCPSCGVSLIRRNGFALLENRLQRSVCPDCRTELPSFRIDSQSAN